MIKLNHAISLSALSLLTLTAVSCQDEDLGYTSDQIAYRANFEKTFGKVSDIPTWDFSSYNLARLGLAGGPSYVGNTRAGGTNYSGSVPGAIPASGIILDTYPTDVDKETAGDGKEFYPVEANTLSWLNENLKESATDPLNVTKGLPFVLAKPTDNFAIIPIYQGHSGMSWDLHLVDATTKNDYTIWTKSQGLRYQVDFNDNPAIDVALDEIYKQTQIWDKDTEQEQNFGSQETFIPLSYLFKAYDESFGAIEVSCQMPNNGDKGAWFKGWFVKGGYNSSTNQFEINEVLFKNNNGDPIDFNYPYQDGESYIFKHTFTADEAKKMSAAAKEDKLFFAVWDNKGWHTVGAECFFGSNESHRGTFHVKTTDGNSHKSWIYLDGVISHEVGHTIGQSVVQGQPINIDKSKINGDFFLYLKITKEDSWHDDYDKKDACQRSDEGMMVALPITGTKAPTNLGSNEYMIIGCEDVHTTASDWDVNDIVFLMVGESTLPRVKETLVKKRYMIEDLGSTFDFDFNDIVVDVTQTQTKLPNGTKETPVTTATLKHLCGTIPFRIKIGNTFLGNNNGKNGIFNGCNENDSYYGCDPAAKHYEEYKTAINCVIDGWDPEENNIIVTTWPNKNTSDTGWKDEGESGFLGEYPESSSTFTFPTNGSYPYIIATDQDVEWMPESVNVPVRWFDLWPDEYYDHTGENKPEQPQQPQHPETNEEYGTEINYRADGEYGADVFIGKILGGKESITLTFVPQNGNTFSFKGCIGGSYPVDGSKWGQTNDSFDVNCTDGKTAIEVTLSLNDKQSTNIVSEYGIGSTYDAKLVLWNDEYNEIYIGGDKVTNTTIDRYFVNSKIKVYYK